MKPLLDKHSWSGFVSLIRRKLLTLQELIDKSKELEETASKIQDDENKQSDLPQAQINVLIEDYQNWFAKCLAILPENLKQIPR